MYWRLFTLSCGLLRQGAETWIHIKKDDLAYHIVSLHCIFSIVYVLFSAVHGTKIN